MRLIQGMLFFLLMAGQCFAQQTAAHDPAGKMEDRLAQYGFQSLFVHKDYNPALPYNVQIHPQAWGFIQDYLATHGKALEKMKTWGLPYFTLIDNVLTQYGLPPALKYLAVIESGLNSQAQSWAGARGPWQFMPGTARDYGLQVNQWRDERTDYFRSSHAAARYLGDLYAELNDWLLVVAAYNGGPGRVYDAIKKAGSRDFWKLQYYLPAESRTHVKKFIATHYIMEGKSGIDVVSHTGQPEFAPEKYDSTLAVQRIAGKFSAVVVAKNLAMDITRFNQLNPNFDAVLAGNNTYDLRLPKEKMDLFNANRYSILNESVQLLMNFFGEEGMETLYPKVSELPSLKKTTPPKKNSP